MKKRIFLVAAILSLAACTPSSSEPIVPIQQDLPEKIVYDFSADLSEAKLDCQKRNGIFNECGSPCGPDADFCIQVCVPVCELKPKTNQPSAGINETSIPLQVPAGFKISEWVTDLPGIRVLAGPDALGNFWYSRTKDGIVSNIQIGKNGEVVSISDVFTGLDRPHGIAFDPQDGLIMYVAETSRISKVRLYTEGNLEKIADLPAGGRHYTRTLLFGPDDRLYVSIGSSCDTCVEKDDRLAAVYVMEKDGANFEPYATGLRNAPFLAIDPVLGGIWVTEMGRDFLGDDLPPDEINVLKAGANYGWPYCYGEQVRDHTFEPERSMDRCGSTEPAKIELQAHSAPLGLAFVPEEGWPEDMALDLLVAYHGSWNRSEPTGYKIRHIKLDDDRNEIEQSDFITGWLDENGQSIGRPVDLLIQPGGTLYITDDKRGMIYKVERLSL
ncbi:PQQ-dependent sugar dehydrogenase [Candidatus Peregrinibacteria bacterium]|nr:MAG: PQQ-dependent sugar dehydrogenase [Candidatus Peregrinibacteria bacterium]